MDSLFRILFLSTALLAFVIIDYPRSIIIPLIKQYKNVLFKDDSFSVFAVFLCDNISWIISAGIFLIAFGTLPQILFYFGVAMMIFGFLLRQWSISKLGVFFSPTIRIIKKHKIITSGPYKYIRHPSYTGMLIFLLGMAIASRSFDSIFFGMAFPICGYLYRIRMEERSLTLHLGKSYVGYTKKTKMLIPFIF